MPIALDSVEIDPQEYLDYVNAKQAMAYWEVRIAAFRAKLKAAATASGAQSLTINDQEVFTHRAIEQFGKKEFEKKDPELAAQYMRRVEKIEIDVELIKRTNPGLYAEYQVHRLEDAK